MPSASQGLGFGLAQAPHKHTVHLEHPSVRTFATLVQLILFLEVELFGTFSLGVLVWKVLTNRHVCLCWCCLFVGGSRECQSIVYTDYLIANALLTFVFLGILCFICCLGNSEDPIDFEGSVSETSLDWGETLPTKKSLLDPS